MKRQLFNLAIIGLLFTTSFSAFSAQFETKVLMMIPNDFMWPEYSEPKALYEKAGFTVVTAGKYKEEVHPDRRNKAVFPDSKAVKVDLSFEDVKVDEFDAITFVAGNGAWHDFFPNQTVHEIIVEAFKKNKVVGLLCASTGILGLVENWDGQGMPIAAGKRAVGYFRVEGLLRNLGKVNYIAGDLKEPGVAVDGNLVTGRNPESSTMFGKKVVEVINSRRKG